MFKLILTKQTLLVVRGMLIFENQNYCRRLHQRRVSLNKFRQIQRYLSTTDQLRDTTSKPKAKTSESTNPQAEPSSDNRHDEPSHERDHTDARKEFNPDQDPEGEGRATDKEEAEQEKKWREYEEKADAHKRTRYNYSDSYAQRTKAIVPSVLFTSQQEKSKDSFLVAIDIFISRDKHRRSHVEFIYSALKSMKEYGVHRDLETYKKIFSVFPQGKFIPTNVFQVEFMHFPKQQQCAIDLMEQMEQFSVQPDKEFQTLIELVFGRRTHPMRKYMRMLYWMPKFKNLSPWPVPEPMPDSSLEIAKLAIQRITSVDLQTKITCLNAMDIEDATDPTWIVSGQSPLQQKLIEELPADRPVYVEGAFRVWLQRVCVNYFILRAEPKIRPKVEKDPDDIGFIQSIFQEKYTETQLETVPTVHEQEDGVILACCATGTSSRDSVLSWIRFLEEANPRLGKDISVLFTLKSPIGPTDDLEAKDAIESGKRQEQPEIFLSDAASAAKEKEKKLYNRLGNLEFGLDPTNPDLSQVGIGELSDTKFVNWPHHHNVKAQDEETDTSRIDGKKSESSKSKVESPKEKFERLVIQEIKELKDDER